LVNDSASELLYPLVPLYLSGVLLAGPRVLGLIEGIAETAASLLKLFSGVLHDRLRRAKPWILWGYGLAGFGRPLIAFATSWPWLLLIRFADRVGKGLRTSPRDALLAASVAPEQRGLAFGVHRALDNAGAVIGPLVASLLLAAGMPLREIFLWSIVPAVLCMLLALAIHEPPTVAVTRKPVDWRWRELPPLFRRYLLVAALFTLGNASNMFLLLRAKELGTDNATVPLLWMSVSVIATVLAAPLSALSDTLGRRRLLCGGYLAYGAVYLALGLLTHGGWPLFAVFAAYGVFLAATEGVEKAFVADLAPAERLGTAFGWFHLTTGLMLLPASVVFGWLYQQFSALAAFGFAAACAFAAAALLLTWVRRAPASKA
jgi:MFS family permease